MKEIAYSIHFPAILEQGCLIIDLKIAIKEKYAYQFLPSPVGLKSSEWIALAHSATDQKALDFLLKEENLFQKKLNKSLSNTILLKQVHIPIGQVNLTLELLSKTQKVFFNEKHLVVDTYGTAEFSFVGHLKDNKQLEISGLLTWKDKKISLSDCLALIPGKPHWFIHGISLKKITRAPSWKQLIEIYKKPILLEGRAKQEFLDDLDPNDLETPQLIMREGSTLQDINASLTPYPVLKLTDRWGAFANLFMDYGDKQIIPFGTGLSEPQNQNNNSLKRQLKEEQNWEKDLLETDFIKKFTPKSAYYCPLDKIAKSLTFLLELGWSIEDYLGRRVVRQTSLNLEFQDLQQHIVIKGKIKYDTHEASVKDVLGAFNRREQFISLSDNSVGLLPIDKTRDTLQDLSDEVEWIGEEAQLKKHRFGALGNLWKEASAPTTLLELKDKWESFTGIQEALPSKQFHGTLRPYQQQGVNWLSFLDTYSFHGILADEMGLGKTVQVLAFLSRLPKGLPHLIVLPTSLLFNWRNEIQQFLPEFRVLLHQDINRSKNTHELLTYDIILTSYTTMRIDLPLLTTLEYRTLILDEAQAIKNADTQTAKAVSQLKSQMRLSITGTPVENNLLELWSHFRFLIPDLFGPLDSFQSDVLASQSDKRYLERIKRKINPFLLRRLKNDVAIDLPERIDQVMWIEMEERQRDFYDALLAKFKGGLLKKVENEGIKKHRMEIFEAILRLRQACCHPLLLSQFHDDTLDLPIPSAKFDALCEDLQTIIDEGHKVLVYSQFTSMLKLMTQFAKQRQWTFGYLDGTTQNREFQVNQFQNDPKQSIFFVSLKAGGVGLNLTAADYVYIYDPWWNEAVEEQAINRAHRIGRTNSVIAKRFVMVESIEEKMMKLKSKKRKLVDELFDTESNASINMTLDDLYYLLT